MITSLMGLAAWAMVGGSALPVADVPWEEIKPQAVQEDEPARDRRGRRRSRKEADVAPPPFDPNVPWEPPKDAKDTRPDTTRADGPVIEEEDLPAPRRKPRPKPVARKPVVPPAPAEPPPVIQTTAPPVLPPTPPATAVVAPPVQIPAPDPPASRVAITQPRISPPAPAQKLVATTATDVSDLIDQCAQSPEMVKKTYKENTGVDVINVMGIGANQDYLVALANRSADLLKMIYPCVARLVTAKEQVLFRYEYKEIAGRIVLFGKY